MVGDLTHLFCAPVTPDPVCVECGTAGRLRGNVELKVTNLPTVGHPTRLQVRVLQFSCDSAEHKTRIIQQRLPPLAEPRTTTTRRHTRQLLQRLAIESDQRVRGRAVLAGYGFRGRSRNPRYGIRRTLKV